MKYTYFCLIILSVLINTPIIHGNILEGANLSNHLHGEKITAKDLQGKVVFVEYWGINCPPCVASMPHLVKLQKKFSGTGKFTIFASHVQGLSPKVKKFLASKNVNFPVYQQARLSKAPCSKGIPSAHLFDHTGKLIASGHPANLYKQVEALVAKAPNPLLHGIKPVFCKSEAKKIASMRSWSAVTKTLNKKVQKGGKSAEEAQMLLDNMKSYLDGRLSTGKICLEDEPTRAYSILTTLSKIAKGLPSGDEAKTLSKALIKDKHVKKLLLINGALTALKEKGGIRKKKNAKKLNGIRSALNKLSENDDASDAVKIEAKSLLSGI